VAADGVTLRLKVAPRAAREKIEGPLPDADGVPVLKVSVTAAPERGRANEAVIALLARSWRLPKSSLAVVAGGAARHKTLKITGDARALAAKLAAWRESRHG
jgi:uncharacterized protein (TIGR00251 family)